MWRALVLGAVLWPLLSAAASAATWRILASQPDGLAAQLRAAGSASGRNEIRTGSVKLEADQALTLFSPDAQALLHLDGLADVSFTDEGDLAVRAGILVLESTGAASAAKVHVTLLSADQPIVEGTAPRGALYVAYTAGGLEFGVSPADPSERLELRAPAPIITGRRMVWRAGNLKDDGDLSSTLVAPYKLAADVLLRRVGIEAARSARSDVQRDLVLNLLSVDVTAPASIAAVPIQAVAEFRVVPTQQATTVTSNLSTTLSQFGVGQQVGGAFSPLEFPADTSPAGLTGSRTGNPGRDTTNGGQGLGTGGFSILGINFFGGVGVTGPGSLVTPR